MPSKEETPEERLQRLIKEVAEGLKINSAFGSGGIVYGPFSMVGRFTVCYN